MKSYYLYRHLDTINNIPFYIGVGTNSENKYYKRSRDKIRRSDEWKEYVKNVCPNYKIEILLECNDYAYISKKEIEFIALYGRKDLNKGSLVNKSDGGRGVSDMSHESFSKMIEKQNCKKVVVFNLQGERIGEYDRISSAIKELNIPAYSARQAVKGHVSQVEGYRIMYSVNAPERLNEVKSTKTKRGIPLHCLNIITGEEHIFSGITEASKVLDIPIGTIGNHLAYSLYAVGKKYRFYYEGFSLREKSNDKLCKNFAIPNNRKKIYLYNLNGDFLREFNSIAETARVLGIKQGSITSCISKKQQQSNNYRFSTVFYKKLPNIKYKINVKTPIKFTNIHTNDIFIFPNIKESAEKLNVSLSSIYHFLYGKTKTIYKKYKCEFLEII